MMETSKAFCATQSATINC